MDRPCFPSFRRTDLRGHRRKCLLLALSGHPTCTDECPLSGVKRTWRGFVSMSANDPYRTLLSVPYRHSDRLRLAWTRGLRGRGALAGAMHWVGLGQQLGVRDRLPTPQPLCDQLRASSIVVSVQDDHVL